MGPEELHDRLHDRFRLLRGGRRGGIDRHRTLHAAVSWSYALLTEHEQSSSTGCRCSPAAGCCHRPNGCAGTTRSRPATSPRDSDSLVAKSLVHRERGPLGTRYRLLETIRQFAEDRLDQRGETVATRDRHLTEVVTLATALDHDARGADELLARRRLADEWDNIRSAHTWAIERGDLPPARAILDATFTSSSMQVRQTHQVMVDRARWTPSGLPAMCTRARSCGRRTGRRCSATRSERSRSPTKRSTSPTILTSRSW